MGSWLSIYLLLCCGPEQSTKYNSAIVNMFGCRQQYVQEGFNPPSVVFVQSAGCPDEFSISKCEIMKSFRGETVWEDHCGANVLLLPIHETKKQNKQKKTNAPRLTSASPVRAKLGRHVSDVTSIFLERRVLIERGLQNLLYIIHV